MSADPAERPQLGALLVGKGRITDAELEHALASQQESGAPLGEILVGLGYASAPVIANALADQHGGPRRIESGYSTGPAQLIGMPLARTVASDSASDEDRPIGLHTTNSPPDQDSATAESESTSDNTATHPVASASSEQEALLPSLAPPNDPLAEARATVETLKAELEHSRAALSQAVAQRNSFQAALKQSQSASASATAALEPLRIQLKRALHEQARQYETLHNLEEELREAHTSDADHKRRRGEHKKLRNRLEQSQVELTTARSRVATLAAQLEQANTERTEDTKALRLALEQSDIELAEEKARVEAMQDQLNDVRRQRTLQDARLAEMTNHPDEAGATLGAAPEPDAHHHLFFPGPKGYSIIERIGPAPAVGTAVEIDSVQFTVLKLGPSTLPESSGRCAFLEAATPAMTPPRAVGCVALPPSKRDDPTRILWSNQWTGSSLQ
jgi:DNA repair exonuclease SbcCD ATPase subunit